MIPWRVKLRTDRGTWFSDARTEEDAVALADRIGDDMDRWSGGNRTLRFPTRYGVQARIRVGAIVSVEPVGPRWDGVDDNARPEPIPAHPDVVPEAADPVPTAPEPADDQVPDAVVRPDAVVVAPPTVSGGTAFLRNRPQRQPRKRGRQ